MKNQVEVKGRDPMVKDLSVEILFHEKRGTFSLNLWRPDGMGRRGMTMNHPQAFRAYALGLLEMADRFEAEVRPEWEAHGGAWITPAQAEGGE